MEDTQEPRKKPAPRKTAKVAADAAPTVKPQAVPAGTPNARAIACELIAVVAQRGKPLDDAIAENVLFGKLDVRDRAFARELSATVFRRFGQIEVAINALLEK